MGQPILPREQKLLTAAIQVGINEGLGSVVLWPINEYCLMKHVLCNTELGWIYERERAHGSLPLILPCFLSATESLGTASTAAAVA